MHQYEICLAVFGVNPAVSLGLPAFIDNRTVVLEMKHADGQAWSPRYTFLPVCSAEKASISDTVYDLLLMYAWLTMFSVVTLDGTVFCFTSAATIRQLLKVVLKEENVRRG
jgi:hypothetical protein